MGWFDQNELFSGMVDIGLSLNLLPERFAYNNISLSRYSLMPLARQGTSNPLAASDVNMYTQHAYKASELRALQITRPASKTTGSMHCLNFPTRWVLGIHQSYTYQMTPLLLKIFLFWFRAVCELWLVSYNPEDVPHSPIHHFVHISANITWKLWSPEVYQACSTQVRSADPGCRCGMCVGVSRSGCDKVLNGCFLVQSSIRNCVPIPHISRTCGQWLVNNGPKYVHVYNKTLCDTLFRAY